MKQAIYAYFRSAALAPILNKYDPDAFVVRVSGMTGPYSSPKLAADRWVDVLVRRKDLRELALELERLADTLDSFESEKTSQ